MSRYRRPVTCRYCWETGHNKRGCPKYKEKLAQGAISSYEELKPRRCSYCGLTGHDRRKCNNLHDDKVNTILANRKWVELVFKDLEKNGVGVGSLLRITQDTYSYSDSTFFLGMVTGFNWENLFYKRPSKAWIKIKNFYGQIKSRTYLYEEGHISFGEEHAVMDRTSGWRDLELVGSIEHCKKVQVVSTVDRPVSALAPAPVLNGGVGIAHWFEGKQSSDYTDNLAKID